MRCVLLIMCAVMFAGSAWAQEAVTRPLSTSEVKALLLEQIRVDLIELQLSGATSVQENAGDMKFGDAVAYEAVTPNQNIDNLRVAVDEFCYFRMGVTCSLRRSITLEARRATSP